MTQENNSSLMKEKSRNKVYGFTVPLLFIVFMVTENSQDHDRQLLNHMMLSLLFVFMVIISVDIMIRVYTLMRVGSKK